MALIEKQAVKDYWDMARPSGIDIAYMVVVTLLLLLIMVLPTIFDEYNTFNSREILATGTGNFIKSILLRIDQLSFTNNVVTFMLWGTVGMVVYAFVSSLLRALAKAEFERELAGDGYVHPSSFSRAKFWREELLISASTVISMALLVAMSAVTLLVFLPMATIHIRSVIISGIQNIWSAAAAVVLLMTGVCLMVLCYKLWRHRIILFEES